MARSGHTNWAKRQAIYKSEATAMRARSIIHCMDTIDEQRRIQTELRNEYDAAVAAGTIDPRQTWFQGWARRQIRERGIQCS